jgi:hypothetical protein
MQRSQTFQAAARQDGFIDVEEMTSKGVRWLKKNAPATIRDPHQLMCIDSIKNRATIFWMILPEGVKAQTFRKVRTLQEWFGRRSEAKTQAMNEQR